MQAVTLAARLALSVVAGLVTSLGTMTVYCDDSSFAVFRSDPARSWERCRSWFGNPIIEWPGGNFSPLFAVSLGIGVGYLVWWLLGRSQKVALVTTVVVVIGVVVGLTPLVISIFTT